MAKSVLISEGEKYGRLTIIKEALNRVTPGGTVRRYFLCKCECGTKKEVVMTHLRNGLTKSCGCFRIERAKSCVGEKSSQWKGGMNFKAKVRASNEYKKWRKDCFERDNYTCQITGQKGGKLNVHHLNQFSVFLDDFEGDFRFDENLWNMDNGITIKEDIHKEFHNKYGYTNFTKENFEEFKNSY